MKRRTAIIITIVALIVPFLLVTTYSLSSQGATAVTEAKTTPQSKYDVGPPEKGELLELVNAERAKYGVAPLVIDERLNQSAQMKADDMVKYNYFDHVNSDGRQGPDYALDVMNHECSYVSENIRDNDNRINTSREAFGAWVVSKPHHTAIIDARYTLTGLGVRDDQVVQHFCIAR